jgi:xylose dehydrogenase (NAD/NADP)
VLGAADIAQKALLPAIAASSNGTVVALASRTRERAREMLVPYGGARVCDSYEALVEQKDVDAVYIPLVNSLHKEWTLRALAAGKHVLCEKPLAMNTGEAEEMAAAAAASGKHLMEAFMYRFDPDMRAFVESLRDPIHIEASFGFRLSDSANYRMHAALGGGALLDVGCYAVSVARWILGEPLEVLARARVDHGVDMTVSSLLTFARGATASLWASFESPEEQDLTVVTRETVQRRERPFTWSRGDDSYRLMVESFGESVLRDQPVALPLSDSIANMRVLDRIRDAFSS